MAAPAPPNRWLRAWRARRPQQADFGDHGTAFGLDLSLSQLNDSRPLPPEPAPALRRSWVQRLRGGRAARSA